MSWKSTAFLFVKIMPKTIDTTATKMQRKEFSLALAQLAYDVFMDKKLGAKVEKQRKEVLEDAQKICDSKL